MSTIKDRQVKAIIRAFCRAMKPPEVDSIADIAEPIAEYQPCGLEHIELPPTVDLTCILGQLPKLSL